MARLCVGEAGVSTQLDFALPSALSVLSVFVVIFWREDNSPQSHKDTNQEKVIDAVAVLFYYCLNAGKEVIEKYMSSKHSEVAET